MEKITDKLYSWASLLEPDTRDQAEALSRLPIIAGHVALMPDAHLGKGSTVGSVIPTDGAVIPAAIGVDIGCGMGAALTNMTSKDLPDSLDSLVDGFDKVVPAGLGHWHREPLPQAYTWWEAHRGEVATELSDKQIKTLLVQLGTLGSGNHFLEIVLDEQDRVWVFLHSGSRGIGNQLASIHIKIARKVCDYELKALRGHRDDEDLAWLTEGTPEFDRYIADMRFAQAYALENRSIMMDSALAYLFKWLTGRRHRPSKNPTELDRINTHHNFTELQQWPPGGEAVRPVWITRKGAIKAGPGDLGLIPGSMGQRSYVVEGLGSLDSYHSCSHGAGRMMSRTRARKELDVASLEKKMSGLAWQRGNARDLLDEHPGAYKNIDQVMADQTDLVKVVHTFRAIGNYKGVS